MSDEALFMRFVAKMVLVLSRRVCLCMEKCYLLGSNETCLFCQMLFYTRHSPQIMQLNKFTQSVTTNLLSCFKIFDAFSKYGLGRQWHFHMHTFEENSCLINNNYFAFLFLVPPLFLSFSLAISLYYQSHSSTNHRIVLALALACTQKCAWMNECIGSATQYSVSMSMNSMHSHTYCDMHFVDLNSHGMNVPHTNDFAPIACASFNTIENSIRTPETVVHGNISILISLVILESCIVQTWNIASAHTHARRVRETHTVTI